MKQLIVFDLDGTIAESKALVDDDMCALVRDLLRLSTVAVISGADWPQFQTQLVSPLPVDADRRNLVLLPTCGTKYYRYDTGWEKVYSEDLTEAEKSTIIAALQRATADVVLGHTDRTWGEQIEDRGTQITLSALGQQAPLEAKKKWDPEFTKRLRMKALLDRTLPECAVRLGGTTSIDVTKQGIDKAYGIRKLRDNLGIAIHDMLFIGDALFPGGNDYPVKEAGVTSIQVDDPHETKLVIETMIACLTSAGAAA